MTTSLPPAVPDEARTGVSVYLVLGMRQNRYAVGAFRALFRHLDEHGVSAARVIELGTGPGGLSVLLNTYCADADFITYDRAETARDHPVLREMGITVRTADLEHPATTAEIAREVQKAGLTILLCDGPRTAAVVRRFARYLKPGDIPMAHDYAPSRPFFESRMTGRLWSWLEVTDADVADVSRRYRLEPLLANAFIPAAWMCRVKRGTDVSPAPPSADDGADVLAVDIGAMDRPALDATRPERVDVLHVDVGRDDGDALRRFDVDRYRPAVVRLSPSNGRGDRRHEPRADLEARGYEVFDVRDGLAAIAPEAPALDATFVTAVYERRADDVLGGRGFPLVRYLWSLASIARMRAPLVVYTQPRLAGRLSEWLRAEGVDARVVARPLSAAPRFWDVSDLRIRRRVHTLPSRDRCHVLCLAKFPWLAEQARDNPFGTTRFYWIDAGLSHPGLFPGRHLPRVDGLCDLFSPAIALGLRRTPGFVVFELSRIAGPTMHSVDLADMQRIAGRGARPIGTHVVGGLFGGLRDHVLRLSSEYDATLAGMLAEGLLGTEENVLTILHARAPGGLAAQTFTTWYHEDTDFTQPAPHDVPFYRTFARLASLPIQK